MTGYQSVLDFWFGGSAAEIQQKKSLWFMRSDETDQAIREQFGELVAQARAGGLTDWLATPEGRLALIILIDQFSRNLFRGSGDAFAADPLALRYALEGMERGDDRGFSLYHKLFFYLPLEHSEDLELQNRCVALQRVLASEAPAEQRADAENFLNYAIRHRDVIARFGRFPHRNERVGRETTSQEAEFLSQPGSSFG